MYLGGADRFFLVIKSGKLNMKHVESCKKCKTSLLNALQNEYGEIIQQWKPAWPCQIKDIRDFGLIKGAAENVLEKVFESLQKHRGYSDFVRSRKMPACDYYIPAFKPLA